MQGLKGLLPRSVLVDQSFAPVLKKAEEHRRATQQCIDYFQQINDVYDKYFASGQKILCEAEQKTTVQCYKSILKILKTGYKPGCDLIENTRVSYKELTSLCNTIFHQFSKFVLSFQQLLRQYQTNQQIIFELTKKYFRTHKTMLVSIDAYKDSFTDVALIYNMDEKIRRYNTCESNYKMVTEEYEIINEKVSRLSDKKMELSEMCNRMEDEFIKVAQIIGSKIIGQAKNFFEYFSRYNKENIATFATEKFTFEANEFNPFFSEIKFENNLQIFDANAELKPTQYSIPYIFVYYPFIREQYLENFNSDLVKYLRVVEEEIEKRKIANKIFIDFINSYFKNIQKSFNGGIKEIMSQFDKMKKRLGQIFSHRLVSFIKSMNSIFDLSSGTNQKMLRRVIPTLQKIQPLLAEENKLLKLFGEQLKTNIQKFVGKKQIKKIQEEEFTEESNIINIRLFRKDIAQKSEFIKHLIEGFYEKMKFNCNKIKNFYTQILNQYYQEINECFTYCCEYQQLYFGEEQFKSNFQKYQNDLQQVLKKQKQFLNELAISSLKTDRQKITFDGELAKVQDFKKIKKPKAIQKVQKIQKIEKIQELPPQQVKVQSKSIQVDKQAVSTSIIQKVSVIDPSEQAPKPAPANRQTIITQDEKQLKAVQFLSKRITFSETEELLKTFSCALAERIVLQGKIFITTERICFYSKFNSGNVFFGGTFIQIPKIDIKKVEKRKNSFFMDNMISLTTINGEVIFTSFFSRDEAYDLICKTFSINLDDEVYEFTETEDMGLPDFLIELEQEDDLKKDSISGREQKINQQLTTFNYLNAIDQQITKEGFNALKIFKIFYSPEPITMNKRSYPNFLVYVKGLINHKDIEVTDFDPPLSQILNQSNLKETAPLMSTRKINVTVPVSAAGVPFMPKTAKSEEIQNFYFISKHKWILEAKISTTGAPYTDTFNIQIRTTVESDEMGKNKISIKYFVNFVKNTMMKAMIQGKSQEQTLGVNKVLIGEIRNYFKNLEQSLHKKKDELSELRQQLGEKEKELLGSEEECSKLKEQMEEMKEMKQKYFYGLIASAVLNLILLIVVCSR